MTKLSDDPYDGLERAFHEPKRLAMMAAIIGMPEREMSFTDLREACDLTDGNLNRHLKTLEEAGAVAFRKSSGPGRSQTVISLTLRGQRAFLQYLAALEAVLKQASAAAARTSPESDGHSAAAFKPTRA
jgi:DNA-binding MarR family transcriptional regulator